MSTYHPKLYRMTYEYESSPLNYHYTPLNGSSKESLVKESQDKAFNYPSIILCETDASRNFRTHRHRYLFYPSASCLSPFNDNNYNIIKNSLRGENNLIKEALDKNNLINKNETSLNQNEKSPLKYQTMYDKSFELVKKVSELVPEEETKLKGNADYYFEKDKDYMNIIDKQIDSLTNHFKNNNFNLGNKTDGNIFKNNNINSSNDDNKMTYDEYKNNLLQRIKNSNTEINPNEYKNNKENIEIKEPINQNQENLRNKNIKENNMNIEEIKNEKEENNNITHNENDRLINTNIDSQINSNNKIINQPNKYNTVGIMPGNNDNNNINQNHSFDNNNINDNNDNIIYQLVNENDNKLILSPEGKPFTGELIEYQYQKGNQIFIKPKSGSDIKLNILRSKEGEPLTYKGYSLMGNDNKFFFDKNGNIIVYPDNEFIKGDKAIKVEICDSKNKNNLMEFNINKSNFDLFGTEIEEEFGGNTGEITKSKKKNKWYMYPKGNGGAKAPIIKKRKKSTKRFK